MITKELSNRINKSYCALADAILHQAKRDASKTNDNSPYKLDAIHFLTTDWADNLRELASMADSFSSMDPRVKYYGIAY